MSASKASATLRVNWVYLSRVALIGATIIGFLAWALASHAYGRWARGEPMVGVWSWPLVIAGDSVFVVLLLALLWKIYCDARTEMGEQALSQPGIFGSRTIRWSEVTRVDKVGFGYHIVSENKTIVLTPQAYLDPDSAITLLRTRLEENKRRKNVLFT